MNIYVQGLIISVVGISLTFLALGLLILAMVLLERFFRDGEPAAPEEEAAPVVEAAAPDTTDAEIAVVIATALAYWRGQSQSGLGAGLAAGPTAWWRMGRAQQSPADALQKIRGRN